MEGKGEVSRNNNKKPISKSRKDKRNKWSKSKKERRKERKEEGRKKFRKGICFENDGYE